MAEIVNSGNSTVDAMAKINLTGNIIPANWFRTITRDNGKPYMLAICILSELCYWYRPQEVRDERSGNIVEYKKKFRGDMLQKSYQDLADRFGESKRSVKAATDRLEELGVIRKEWRNLKLRNGAVINNVLFIDLNADVLSGLTYGLPETVEEISQGIFESEDYDSDEKIEINEKMDDTAPVYDPVAEFCNNMLQGDASYEKKENQVQNKEISVTEKEDTDIHFKVGQLTISRDTNTKITSENKSEIIKENTTESKKDFSKYGNTSNPIVSGNDKSQVRFQLDESRRDKIGMIRDLIKENVNYDYIIMSNKGFTKMLDEIVEIMAETIVNDQDVMISGVKIPHSVIESRFEKYDYSMMIYVLESLESNTTKVLNVRKYILATLYNAPSTLNIGMNMKINNALYG